MIFLQTCLIVTETLGRNLQIDLSLIQIGLSLIQIQLSLHVELSHMRMRLSLVQID